MTAPEQHPAADQLIAAVHEAISEQGYPRLHDEDAAAVATAVLQWAVYNCEDLWPQADSLAWISRLADAMEPPPRGHVCAYCELPVDMTLSGGVPLQDRRCAHRACADRARDEGEAAR